MTGLFVFPSFELDSNYHTQGEANQSELSGKQLMTLAVDISESESSMFDVD